MSEYPFNEIQDQVDNINKFVDQKIGKFIFLTKTQQEILANGLEIQNVGEITKNYERKIKELERRNLRLENENSNLFKQLSQTLK